MFKYTNIGPLHIQLLAMRGSVDQVVTGTNHSQCCMSLLHSGSENGKKDCDTRGLSRQSIFKHKNVTLTFSYFIYFHSYLSGPVYVHYFYFCVILLLFLMLYSIILNIILLYYIFYYIISTLYLCFLDVFNCKHHVNQHIAAKWILINLNLYLTL